MAQPDWILVHTPDRGAIQARLEDYAARCEAKSPSPRTVTVRLVEPGSYAVGFAPAAKRLDFLNLVGHLSDHPAVSRCVAWITEGATRYALEPDRARLSAHAETEFLIGCSAAGRCVEACLSDGVAALVQVPRQGAWIQAPALPRAGEPVLRFLVLLET